MRIAREGAAQVPEWWRFMSGDESGGGACYGCAQAQGRISRNDKGKDCGEVNLVWSLLL